MDCCCPLVGPEVVEYSNGLGEDRYENKKVSVVDVIWADSCCNLQPGKLSPVQNTERLIDILLRKY